MSFPYFFFFSLSNLISPTRSSHPTYIDSQSNIEVIYSIRSFVTFTTSSLQTSYPRRCYARREIRWRTEALVYLFSCSPFSHEPSDYTSKPPIHIMHDAVPTTVPSRPYPGSGEHVHPRKGTAATTITCALVNEALWGPGLALTAGPRRE